MSTLVDLCAWALALDPADAPPEVPRAMRLQMLSTVAATTVGLAADDVSAVLALARTRPGPFSVAPGASEMDVEGALAAAAGLVSVDSYDDWLLTARPGPSVWAVWLTAAELERSWEDTFRAQLAVNELLSRLGGLTLPGVREGRSRIWLHAAGAALATSMLLDLDAEQAAHAIGTAVAGAARPHRSIELGSGHLVAVGEAVLLGRRCAFLAARGLEGPSHGFDPGAHVVGRLAGGRPLRHWLTGLGSAWLTTSLSFGVTPGGPLNACAVEAVLELLSAAEEETGGPLKSSDVLRVDVEATVLTCARARHFELRADAPASDRFSPGLTQRSLPRAIAAAVEHGRFTPDELRPAALEKVVVGAADLPGRVHTHHEWQLSLRTWDALKTALGGEGLFDGLGPRGIARLIAGRTGGMAWMELPFALAADAMQTTGHDIRDFPAELADDPGAVLARGVQVAADWAAKRMERLFLGPPLGGEEGPIAATTFDLADQAWERFALPLPARVKVLLHGGRVLEAERDHPFGSPARPPEETLAKVFEKWLAAGPSDDTQRWSEIARGLVAVDGSLPSLPEGGPRVLLKRLTASD